MRMIHARASTSLGDTLRNAGQGRPRTQTRTCLGHTCALGTHFPISSSQESVQMGAPAQAEGTLVTPRSVEHGQRQVLSHGGSTLHISSFGGGCGIVFESLCVISQVASLCCSQFISAMPFP